MADTKYSNAQRVAFAGLVIGFLMCTSGAIAPYWQKGEISIDTFTKIIGENIPFIGDIKLLKMNGGLWWFCAESILGDKECEAYSLDEGEGGDWAIRICVVVNILLTLLCALVALCRTCCCGGGKTICHGIMAFIAGGAGIGGTILFATLASDGYGMKLNLVKFGWAFFVYAVGCGIVFLVSFVLCFASPDNPLTPMIIGGMGQIMVSSSTSSYNRMPNDAHVEMNGHHNMDNAGIANVPPVHVQGY